ncbi:MAG: acylphosphatase [Porphyromonadaceae bacterium]|nr:MAG: acylphosphatase [Porphyromonadaceae bacterium]
MDMESDCRAKIKVIGRVQGVGYRYSTLLMAKNLKLTGYVKNLPDESVYIEAQGSPDSVGNLVEWCKTGPPRAIVESVEYSFHPVMDFKNFQIR